MVVEKICYELFLFAEMFWWEKTNRWSGYENIIQPSALENIKVWENSIAFEMVDIDFFKRTYIMILSQALGIFIFT